MSFLTVVEQDAKDVENAVVAGLKTAITYVDNVTVTELIPELQTALMTASQRTAESELRERVAKLEAINQMRKQ